METPEPYVTALDTLPLWRRNDGDGSKVASRRLVANGKARLQRLQTLRADRGILGISTTTTITHWTTCACLAAPMAVWLQIPCGRIVDMARRNNALTPR